MTLKCEKTKIIEPVNPNKSTGLFTGASSGILNWNDLLYPEMHKLRTKIRDTFYSASRYKTQLPESFDMNLVYPHTKKILQLTQVNINVLSQLEGLVTDPSLVSIMATMSDQMYEHIRSMYRIGTEEFESLVVKNNAIQENYTPSKTLALLKEVINIKQQINSELESFKTTLSEHEELHETLQHIQQDHNNHLEFLDKILEIATNEFQQKGLV